jgi:hypothetical protein
VAVAAVPANSGVQLITLGAALARSLSELSADSSMPHGSTQRIHTVAGPNIVSMTSELLSENLTERYMRACGLRSLRGEHEGEYFAVVDAHPRRLHVHLEMAPSFGDMLTIQITPACLFPLADQSWITHFADAWNRQNHEVTAIVHRSTSDRQRIGVSARRSQWIREGISFEDFASFVDRTIAAAIDLFAGLTPVVELPSRAHSLQLRKAS